MIAFNTALAEMLMRGSRPPLESKSRYMLDKNICASSVNPKQLDSTAANKLIEPKKTTTSGG